VKHKYCLDTSGLSNPVIEMPADIFVSLWPKIISVIEAETLCWNAEISEELSKIPGQVGECLKKCSKTCCLEVDQDHWAWQSYLACVAEWQVTYKEFISEYNGNRKNTIGLNDLSIVALAKTLGLPVVSMEKRNHTQPSQQRMRIPELCDKVDVKHLSFMEFLQAEGITV
jgi:hypothetical protein